MGVFEVEAEGASAQETAERISRSGIEVGHLTAVLVEVPTKLDRIQENNSMRTESAPGGECI
jgi:hypothetical protein